MRRAGTAVTSIGVLALAAFALASCNKKTQSSASGARQYADLPGSPRMVPAASAFPSDDGNWVMPGKDYASTRFSALNQINAGNIGKLSLAFTFSTGTINGFEAPPL